MKEFNDLMEAIEKRDIPKALQFSAKMVGYPKGAKDDEHAQKLIDNAVKHALTHHFAQDEELNDLFAHFSFELGMNELIKKLDINVSPKGGENKTGEFLKKLIDEIFD